MRLSIGFSQMLALIFLPASSAFGAPLHVTELRPDHDCGGFFVRLIAGFQTPQIFEVRLDPALVDSILPNRLEPRLVRNEPGMMGKLSDAARNPKVIEEFKGEIRETKKVLPIYDAENLATLFPDRRAHTFAVTGSHFSFAPTGPAKTIDQVSKHVIVSHDINDVRFAGQIWRDGKILCYSGNSGTFMKKRDKNPAMQLTAAPDPKSLLPLLTSVFGAALKVKHCDRIAPGFGGAEALDQAEKALLAADAAELAAKTGTIPERAAKAVSAAKKAREAAAEANAKAEAAERLEKLAEESAKESSEIQAMVKADLVVADEAAAAAAEAAKEARKKADKAVKNLSKPLKDKSDE